jgi:hypothetical protein
MLACGVVEIVATIGVPAEGLPGEGPLDLVVAGVGGDAEDVVVGRRGGDPLLVAG